MKSPVFLSLVIAALLIGGHTAIAQEGDAPAPEGYDMDAAMKLWQEVSTPSAEHQRLNDWVGSWETTSTVWMDPANPVVTSGKADFQWVLGDRFLEQRFTGELMGMPFSGIGYNGYDIYNKKYVGFWIDNSSTAMFTMEGTFDQSGTILTMYGKMDEWMTGERDKNVKYVIRPRGPDTFVFEIHDLAIGGEKTKVMEIEYRRVKQ